MMSTHLAVSKPSATPRRPSLPRLKVFTHIILLVKKRAINSRLHDIEIRDAYGNRAKVGLYLLFQHLYLILYHTVRTRAEGVT